MTQAFNIIYGDPAWEYNSKKTGGNMTSGAADQYQTLSTDQICQMPVVQMFARDAVCFLWVTVPMLEDGLKVLRSWGFEYTTMITWHKIMSWGLGYWFRGQTEHILFGVRGNVEAFRFQKANFKALALTEADRQMIARLLDEKLGAKGQDLWGGYPPVVWMGDVLKVFQDNCVHVKALRHSEKPEEFREMIVQATSKMPHPNRLELFARKQTEGWTCMGNELEGSDLRGIKTLERFDQ